MPDLYTTYITLYIYLPQQHQHTRVNYFLLTTKRCHGNNRYTNQKHVEFVQCTNALYYDNKYLEVALAVWVVYILLHSVAPEPPL